MLLIQICIRLCSNGREISQHNKIQNAASSFKGGLESSTDLSGLLAFSPLSRDTNVDVSFLYKLRDNF